MVEATIEINKSSGRMVQQIKNGDGKKKFREYLFFWGGQQASLLGSSIVSFAIIWWLTEVTKSELILGISSLISFGPFVLVAPFGGVLADRLNRKMILITMDALQASATVILAILFLTGHASLGVIFVILGVRGVAQAFHMPVSMALVPTMVPAKHLSRMNGLTYLFSGVIQIVGPAVAAALLAIPGIQVGIILWVDVITFSMALLPMFFVKIPAVTKTADKQQSFSSQFTEGFRILKETKGMIALLFAATMVNFFSTPLFALLSLYVNKTQLGEAGNYALVIGLLQGGVVLGGIIMSLFKGFKKPILFLLFSVLFQFLAIIALAFVPNTLSGRFWIIGAILFLLAIPLAIVDVSIITSLQVMIPREKMGRVSAVVITIASAIRPLGQFLSGVIGEYTGIKILFITASVLGGVSILAIWFFTPIKQLDKEIAKAMTKAMSGEKESKEDDLEMSVNETKVDSMNLRKQDEKNISKG